MCLKDHISILEWSNSPSEDVVIGLVSAIERDTGLTVPWWGEGASTGVK